MSEYHSKIVGTTFEGRQDIIATLKGDELLRVRREPENEYDGQAELAQEIELATAKRLLSKIENERTIKDEV